MRKPHKGTLSEWHKADCPYGIGYTIWGLLNCAEDDQRGYLKWGHTSYLVKHDEKTGEIETRNSHYTLLGPESPRPEVERG